MLIGVELLDASPFDAWPLPDTALLGAALSAAAPSEVVTPLEVGAALSAGVAARKVAPQ